MSTKGSADWIGRTDTHLKNERCSGSLNVAGATGDDPLLTNEPELARTMAAGVA
jgi:hypothetical protein